MYEELNLLSGERVLWSGKPERRRLFDRGDALSIPFMVLWLGFGVFWIVSARRGDIPQSFVLWAGLIVAFGAVQFVAQPVIRYIRSGATRYTVTDRRLIEIVDRPRKRRTEQYLRHLRPPVLRPDGAEQVGSIAFGQFPSPLEPFRRQKDPVIVLYDIAQPRFVRDLITDAQARVGK